MTLSVDFRVNQTLIAEMAIGRVEGSAAPDSVNGYDWWYREMPRGTTQCAMPVHSGHVKHRYGDGAPELVRKVCEHLGSLGVGGV